VLQPSFDVGDLGRRADAAQVQRRRGAGVALLQRPAHCPAALQCDGLFEKVERADPACLDRGLSCHVRRNRRASSAVRRQPIPRNSVMPSVSGIRSKQHHRGPQMIPVRARLASILGQLDRVAFVLEYLGEQFPYSDFVVDHQNFVLLSPWLLIPTTMPPPRSAAAQC
jgi:hypothetical protein